MAKAYVPIQLDKARNFRFGMRALELIEDKLETPISKLDFNNLTMKQLKIVIWAGLVHEDPELKLDDIWDIIDEYSDLKTVTSVMGKAIQEAFGNPNSQRAAK